MSSFFLKIIAIISMLFDHSGDVLLRHTSVLNVIGRMAFPLFAFQLVIGFKKTSNIKKYFLRLISFALISQIPFSIMMYLLGFNIFTLNIFFTLALGLLTLFLYEKIPNKILKFLPVLILIGLAELLNTDYGAWGVFLIFFIYILCPNKYISESKNKKVKITKYVLFTILYLGLCFLNYCKYIGNFPVKWIVSLTLGAYLPIIFMLLYNGKKGPSVKYIFYLFYPVHIIILDIIGFLMHK